MGREIAMSNQFIDLNAPSLQGKLPKLPHELPHGLIVPPNRVRELIEQERKKHPAANFAKAEERLLNEWTLQYHFDNPGHEVLYRQTPEGPDVLAVGFEEIFARTKGMNPDEMTGQETWMPS
jgi:hypothetical protein